MQVTHVSISVRAYPWQRQVVDGRAHNHAFIFCPEVEHTCKVSKKRGGKVSFRNIFAGIPKRSSLSHRCFQSWILKTVYLILLSVTRTTMKTSLRLCIISTRAFWVKWRCEQSVLDQWSFDRRVMRCNDGSPVLSLYEEKNTCHFLQKCLESALISIIKRHHHGKAVIS